MRTSPWAGALLAMLLAVFAVAPLAYPGFFEAQTGFGPSFRVQSLPSGGLLDRADPVRGEGSLAYWLAWPFLKLTGSGIAAVKWGYSLSFVLGALAMYAWARLRLGTEGGVLAAAVYTYLPWHLATVYLRGSYAEAWLWALWPAFLWAWDAPWERGRWILRLAGLVLAAAALLIQPGLTFGFLALLVVYAVAVWRVRWWPARLLASGVALVLLVAGARITTGLGGPDLAAPTGFLWPYQLFSAAWVQDLSGGVLPYQLGVAAVALSMVTLGLWAVGRHRAGSTGQAPLSRAISDLGPSLVFWMGSLLAILFFTQQLSARLWTALGLSSLVTHPYQLLILAGLPLAFVSGACVRLDRRLAERPVWAVLAALAVLASYAYLAPRFTQIDPGTAPVAGMQPAGQAAPSVHLLEAELTPAAEITSSLTVTLTWQALAPIETDYTVFLHLLAGEVKIAQGDSWPCAGACPTHTWQPGQIVVDVHDITIGAGAPPGPYRLALGLYYGATGERVAVAGRGDGTVYLDVR